MSKRPQIKGRGADIYLGSDSKERPTLQQSASEEAKISGKMNSAKVRESSTKLGESLCSFEGVKKIAAWYIEKSESLAKQAIELQEKRTEWAKETLLAPMFEAQSSIARKFVECSASAVRNLWRIH
jgi:hypothetical protein